MHPATSIAASPPRLVRRLVLGGAVVLALAIALGAPVAGRPRPGTATSRGRRPGRSQGAGAAHRPTPRSRMATSGSATVDIRVDKGKKSVTIEKSTKPSVGITTDDDEEDSGPVVGVGPGKHGKRVRVGRFRRRSRVRFVQRFRAHGARPRVHGRHDRRAGLPVAGARDRADPLVPDAQGADAERDDAEARRERASFRRPRR